MKTINIKFKRTVTESREEIIEVPYPHYRKGAAHFYKVFSDNNCIQVFHSEYSPNMTNVSITYNGLAFENDTKECAKEEFEVAFEKAINHLKTC